MATESAIRHYAALLERGMAESIIYTPTGGTARTITALIDRQPPTLEFGAPSPRIRIRLLNDATAGIEAQAMNHLRDTLTFAEIAGGTAHVQPTGQMVYSDADEIVLEVA